jgi:hypothetical protein
MDFNNNDELLNEKAIFLTTDNEGILPLCSKCEQFLRNNKAPPLSIANGFHFKYPFHLPKLNYIESHIISRLQIQTGIVKLSQFSRINSQFGFRGHFITKPQNPDQLLNILPMNISTLSDALHVIFVTEKKGQPPTLNTFKSLFKVSRSKIKSWLLWLKTNNPYYANVEISDENLQSYPDESVLPLNCTIIADKNNQDFIAENGAVPSQTLDLPPETFSDLQTSILIDETGSTLPFEEVYSGIMHTFENHHGSISFPKDTIALVSPDKPIWSNHPCFYAWAFPTLFPYGITHPNMKRSIIPSLSDQIEYLLTIENPVFRNSISFLCCCYDNLLKFQIFKSIRFQLPRIKSHDLASISRITEEDIKKAITAQHSKKSNDTPESMNSLLKNIHLINFGICN